MSSPASFRHLSPEALRNAIEDRQFQIDTLDFGAGGRSTGVKLGEEVRAMEEELHARAYDTSGQTSDEMGVNASPSRDIPTAANIELHWEKDANTPAGSVSLTCSPSSVFSATKIAMREQQRRPQTSQSVPISQARFDVYPDNAHPALEPHPASDGIFLASSPSSARHVYNGLGRGPRLEFGKPAWDFSQIDTGHPPPSPTFHHVPIGAMTSKNTSDSTNGQSSTGSSPPLPKLNATRKRRRDSQNLVYASEHSTKSMRATPSPALTGAVTPASTDGFDFSDADEDLLRLLGGDPREHMDELRNEQIEAERIVKAREEQVHRDEELARTLSNEEYGQGFSDRPSSAASFNAFNVSAAYSRPESTGSFIPYGSVARPSLLPHATLPAGFGAPTPAAARPSAPNMPSSPYPSSNSHGRATPNQFQHSSMRKTPTNGAMMGRSPHTLKQERYKPYEPIGFQSQPNFIDLANSDSDDDAAVLESSDPVEIPPSGFHHNTNGPVQSNNFINSGSASASGFSSGSRKNVEYINLDDDSAGSSSMGVWAPPAPPFHLGSYGQQIGSGGYDPAMNNDQNTIGSTSWPWMLGSVGRALQNGVNGISSAASMAKDLLDAQTLNFPGASGYGHPSMGSAGTAGYLGPMPGLAPGIGFQPHERLAFNPLGNADAAHRHLSAMADVAGDSKKTLKDLQNLMDNIRPDAQDLDPRTRIGTPDAMVTAANLYEHQKLGLAWLIKMEEGSNKGGILADDMGLGKTIQAIALMVSRRSSDPARKTNLLVAPVALLRQWEAEIKTKLKPDREHRLSTYLYHGTGRITTWENLRKYDVVITTYGTLAAEFKRKQRIDGLKKLNPNWISFSAKDKLPVLGDECKFHRIILDEAQNIKNKATKSAQATYCLQAMTRVAMSGTPMQNNIEELFSLIHFLQIQPYSSYSKFSTDFGRPFKGNSQTAKDRAMKKLQALLKAILLRRTKKSTVDGKPIITLPDRTTEVQHAVFSHDEHELYVALETKTQLTFNRYLKAGTVGRNYSNVLVLLLRLRQACCHPHLIKDFGMPAGGAAADVSVDDMIKLAEGLPVDVVSRIKEAGDMTNECPICMDMTANATIFTPCGHSTCSECFTRIQDPTQAHEDAEIGGVAIKCPNCRGKVDSKKVTDWASFKKVHLPELIDEGTNLVKADIEPASDTDSDESENDDDSEGSLADFIDDGTETESGRDGNKTKKVARYKAKGKGKTIDPSGPKEPKSTLAQLKLASRKNVKARRKYLRRLAKDFVTSGKIEKAMEILEQITARDANEKTIIFSQFTSLLDLLEVALKTRDYIYERYDGSMSSNSRNDAVIEFTSKANCKIMLVSLKAGNSGLNLTCASQVIMMDPFWNPFIEEQAIDRAHRIGQRRPVQVHRILVASTVEDRIIALQEKKRTLIEGALDENASASIGRLGVQELAFLFGVPA